MNAPLQILYLEDSLDDAQLIMLHLEQEGLKAEYQRVDTEAAFRTALASPPDLILSDFAMPRFNGLRALQILKEVRLDIPFILVSGTIGEDVAVEALKQGADDYLMKDRPERLGSAIQSALNKKQLRDEKKRADSALRHSEARYRLATRATNDTIWEWDAHTNQLLWAENAQLAFGYSPEEVGLDATWWDNRIHPEDRQRVLLKLEALLQSLELVWADEYRFQRKDGSFANVSDHGYIERDVNGHAIRLIGAMSDITVRKQAEERIQRQLQQLSALRAIDIAISSTFDMKPSLAILLNKLISQLGVSAATILLFNPLTLTLEYALGSGFITQGIEKAHLRIGESLAGRAALERRAIYVPDLRKTEIVPALIAVMLDERLISYYAVPLLAKGELKGVLEIFHRAAIQTEPEWLEFLEALAGQAAIAIDNAQLFESLQRSKIELEHRVAQRTAELNRTNRELEYANRIKDEFLANTSHELRTPLNSILGLSETLLEQRRGPLNDYQQKALLTVIASAQHLLALINDILDLSKLEAGKFEYYPQPVSVDDLCRSSLTVINGLAFKKSIAVTYENKTDVTKIAADPLRIKQIIINLLTNAIKFTPENGQVILRVETNLEKDRVQFSVIDTGIGIAPEDLPRLFQPFVQLDSNLNRQFEGTGLGLALVQKLTDLHGGSVDVESQVGEGSCFTINLPVSMELGQQIETARSPIDPPVHGRRDEASRSGHTILLAEDNTSNILTMSDYLEDHGYKIVIAHDGSEAIARAEAVNPSIILMDIQMPVMDGLEAIKRLRQNPQFVSLPIIALTALAMPGDRERCLEAGATEYLSKPVGLKNLLKTIDKYLENQ